MNLKPYQQCRSAEGWQPVQIPSTSKEGTTHLVMVCHWGTPHENICDCPGYFFRGTCRHQTEAMNLVCGWSELTSKEVQTEEMKKYKVCPRCGKATDWKMEVVDDGGA